MSMYGSCTSRLRGAVILTCALMTACEYFPNSEFELSSDSRLPRWFELSAGVSRRDVSVEMSYYHDHVRFVLRDKRNGSRLATVRGEVLNHQPLRQAKPRETDPGGRSEELLRPGYSVVKVNEIVEIVEHRRQEPIFDISDDPDVRAKLIEMLRTKWGIEGVK